MPLDVLMVIRKHKLVFLVYLPAQLGVRIISPIVNRSILRLVPGKAVDIFGPAQIRHIGEQPELILDYRAAYVARPIDLITKSNKLALQRCAFGVVVLKALGAIV